MRMTCKYKVGQKFIIVKQCTELFDDPACKIGQVWKIEAFIPNNNIYKDAVKLIHTKNENDWWHMHISRLEQIFMPLSSKLAKILYEE